MQCSRLLYVYRTGIPNGCKLRYICDPKGLGPGYPKGFRTGSLDGTEIWHYMVGA